MKNKNKIFLFFYFFFSLVMLLSCKEEKKEVFNNSNKTFKIGGIGPISGGVAIYGNAVKNGIQIAVDEINKNGGINGYQIEYKFADDEHDAEKSVNAYNSLKDWGMQMLVGTTTSTPCEVVSIKSNKDNMFQITPSATSVASATKPNVFRMCFSDPNQGKASAQFINTHKLAKKVGIIYDSSDVYSTGIYEKFVEESKGNNYEIVDVEQFTSDSKTDFTAQLNKLKESGAELVFIPFYYSESSLVLNQANMLNYKPKFFSCDGMEGILTLENFDKSLAENVMFLTPFSVDEKSSLNFVNSYKSKYSEVPNQFAADAYDCVYAIKMAVEKANVNPEMSVKEISDKLKVAMTQISYNGLTGKNITWDVEGEPNKTPKAVIIKNGTYTLLK